MSWTRSLSTDGPTPSRRSRSRRPRVRPRSRLLKKISDARRAKNRRPQAHWGRIPGEPAFDEIGGKIVDVIQKYGPQALIDDHCTNGLGMVRGASEVTVTGLTALLGGVSYDINFLIGDFNPGQYLTFGQFQHAPGIETWFLADTLILLSNPVYANIPDIHYILEARYRGAQVVAIAP